MKTLIVIVILAFGALLMWFAGPAKSMGWYDHVRYTAKLGFKVDVIVPFNAARPCLAQFYHGCANTTAFLCLYVPVNT